MSGFFSVFIAVFIAEVGDKTQLATALFASREGARPLTVLLAASSALTASTAIAVFAGSALKSRLESLPLDYIAGGLFIALGAWMIARKLMGAE